MANTGRQSVYSPLPQSFSDSDSDKELQMESLHTSYSNHVHHRPQNGVYIHSNHGNYIQKSNHNVINHVQIKSLNDGSGFSAMSASRKAAFIFSIFLCFFVIFIFLFVLPCEQGTCPVHIVKWDRTHDNIEMFGSINVIKTAWYHKDNLAILFKHSIKLEDIDNSNGVMSVTGNNGNTAWTIKQNEMPTDLNCNDFDANVDGVLDCIITFANNLKVIEPVSGKVIWNHSLQQITDKPLVIDDMNSDYVNDLLLVKNSNEIVVLSGADGRILLSTTLKNCSIVESEAFFEGSYLYSCMQNSGEVFYKMDQSKLKERAPRAIAVSYQRKSEDVPLTDRTLRFRNTGVCPKCNASITLFDDKSNNAILNWSYANAYVMKPKTFSFNSTKSNIALFKGHVNGFILKLWQWTGTKKMKTTRNKRFIASPDIINSISERIVLITFNETNYHIINASSNEIKQLCCVVKNVKGKQCQPELQNKNDSILIADLNGDNTLELISYSTTYEYDIDGDAWRLVTNMNLIRLETELPLLYKNNTTVIHTGIKDLL